MVEVGRDPPTKGSLQCSARKHRPTGTGMSQSIAQVAGARRWRYLASGEAVVLIPTHFVHPVAPSILASGGTRVGGLGGWGGVPGA